MPDDNAPETLTGQWQGRYYYPRRPDPVGFEASIFDREGELGGSITERSTLPDMNGAVLYATLRGTRRGQRVRFTKSYEVNDRRYGRVNYSGKLSADRLHIAGRWHIAGTFGLISGKFEMTRPGRVANSERIGVKLVEPVM
jgi:hypothetical protein